MSEAPTDRPPLAILSYVNPAAFAPHHLRQLYRLEKHSWDGLTARECALRIATGELWLWEVANEDKAIVLTSVVVDRTSRVLWIEGAAGNGIIAAGADIVADLQAIAEFYDCPRLRATSEREGFKSLPDLLGFNAVSTIWELETDHERRRIEPTGTADGDAEDGAVGRGEAVL